jgi:hypothetical protein
MEMPCRELVGVESVVRIEWDRQKMNGGREKNGRHKGEPTDLGVLNAMRTRAKAKSDHWTYPPFEYPLLV